MDRSDGIYPLAFVFCGPIHPTARMLLSGSDHYDGRAPRIGKSNSHGPLTMLPQRSMKEEVYRAHAREMNTAYASRVNPKIGVAEQKKVIRLTFHQDDPIRVRHVW
jgi:hypothetical protein